jgi:Phenazine biosynthesis-like protein
MAAEALTNPGAGRMRAIAREFNQSETSFLLHPSLPGATWRLRSFTRTGAEVFGAGQNALGPGYGWPPPDGSDPAAPPPTRGWRRKSAARCWRSRWPGRRAARPRCGWTSHRRGSAHPWVTAPGWPPAWA